MHIAISELPLLQNFPINGPRLLRGAPPLVRTRSRIAPDVLERFERVCRANDADLTAGLHAVFALLLARCSGEHDVHLATPTLAPGHWVLHTALAHAPSFRALLAQSRDAIREAHERAPIRLAGATLPTSNGDAPHALLFQLDLVQRDGRAPDQAAAISGDLALCAAHTVDGMSLEWVHAEDVLDAAAIARLVRRLDVLVDAVSRDADVDPARVSLLDAAERRQVLVDWNDTAAPFERRTLHELFAEQARRTPDAIALVCRGERLSYRELDQRANRLAHHLRAQGVSAQGLVAVCLERTPQLVIALLAIHKAGGAYVPLDPHYPQERIDFMLADSGAPWVIAQSCTLGHSNAQFVRITVDDPELQQRLLAYPSEDPAPLPGHDANALAYIIYTSGSTGRPKGVCIEHVQAAAMIGWAQEVYDADALSGVLAATSICFDLSVFELFVPLCSGGRVVLVDSPLDFEGIANAPDLRLINTVPSAIKALLDENSIPASVRIVNLAGEPLPEALVKDIYANTAADAVYNLYGPSEDTTYSTYALIPRGKDGAPSIGRPISNGQAYVLDRHLDPVPVGVVGEVYVGGAGVTRGYWRRPDMTAERYIPDPFLGVPGARLYKTGDLARWMPDGELEFLGRADFQVKLRGLRIELGEIQARLLDVDAVDDAVVTVRDDARGEKQLVAYVVPADATSAQAELIQACRSALAEALPEYMIPAAFVAMTALPLTPNGKIDRAALPPPPEAAAPDYVAPRSELERRLAQLWQDVLRLPTAVGITANFFDLGGNSLHAMRLLARVRQVHHVVLPPSSLFAGGTLEDFARLVAQGGEQGSPPLVRLDHGDAPAPSFVQQGLWLIDRLEGGSAQYNVQLRFLVEGELDVRALRAALDAVSQRHESLRTVIVTEQQQPVLRVLDAVDVPFVRIDLCELSRTLQTIEVERIVRDDLLAAFALDRDSMLRATLVQLEPARHELLLTMHHVATDGWSLDVLVAELGALYRAERAGQQAALPPLPVQYRDYAAWERGWLQGDVLEQQAQYWVQQLAGVPLVHGLPLDRPRQPQQGFAGGVVRTRIPAPAMHALKDLCRVERATLFMGLHAAFSLLLARHSGEQDIVVGTPVANREQPELAALIGLFTNTVVLRTRIEGGSTFIDALRQSRRVMLDGYAHQHVPFPHLVDRLQPERSLSHMPIFQVMLSLQDTGRTPLELPGLAVTTRPPHIELALVELTLEVTESADGLLLDWIYRRELFDPSTIERMARHFEHLLRGALAQPRLDVLQLPMLDPAERTPAAGQQLYVLNEALQPQPVGVVGELYIGAATLAPDYPDAEAAIRERLVRNPFGDDPGLTLYRSGDLVRRLADGTLEFVGRADARAKPGVRVDAVATADAEPRHGALPQTATQVVLHELWSRLLQRDAVGIDMNFFAAGGNSLLLMRMIHGVRERLGARLAVKDVFAAPTIRRLAAALETRDAIDEPSPERMHERRESGSAPLSLSQFRIWYVEQTRSSNEHNIPFAIALRGEVDRQRLERALNRLVERHDMLRAGFVLEGDAPVQIIRASSSLTLEYRDLAGLQPAEIEASARILAVGHATRRFDIQRPPLLSALLVRIAADEYRLHLNLHHLVFDGWSFAILLDELLAIYAALARNTEPALPALSNGYADYVLWQRRWLEGEEARAQGAFWREYLQGCPERLALARQVGWPDDGDDAPARVVATLTGANRQRLLQLARERESTPFSVLYSAFALLLGRLAGQHDLTIGIPVSGRHVRAAQGVIGNFVNNLPVRTRWQPQQAFGDYLSAEIRNLEQVLSNQDYPFEKILEVAPFMRGTDATPGFQVFFNMVPGAPQRTQQGPFETELESAAETEAKFDLTLYVHDDGDEITLTCHYKHELFASAGIAHLLRQYEFLLEQVGSDPLRPCGEYSLRPDTQEERRSDLVPQHYWQGPVHALFRRHANERPHATAIVEHGQQWSYGEMLDASASLARELQQQGIGRGDVVAIVAARRACLVVGMLAVLQAGAAFSLLNPEYPVERVCTLVDIVKPACVLFAGEQALFASPLVERLEAMTACRYLPVAKAAHRCDAEGFVPAEVEPQQLACVTFTSGTTGIPKAVAGTHVGIAGYLSWVPQWLQLTPDDRFSLLSGLGHDPLQRDVFTSLCIGATLVIPEPDAIAPHALARWLLANAITFVHLTPAMTEILCTTDATRFPSLRIAFITGEKLGSATVSRLLGYNPAMRVLNSYGTTETQRATTYFEASAARGRTGAVPVSEASPDTVIRVLNAMGAPCGLCEVGDIFVESHALSRGYLNDPQLTAEVLSELPDGRRRYRTGDVGCRLPDGTIMLLGRKDGQIKIRGFRVETGEIEAHARSHAAVKDAAVVAVQRQGLEAVLVAYVVPARHGADDRALRADVLEHLRSHLPPYMVPAAIVAVDRLPLTPNGKLDRRALPEPVWDEAVGAVAPRTDVEREIAEIWAEVLGLERVGVEDDFFELGGHSMLMVLLLIRIQERLGTGIDIGRILSCTTVAAQAQALSAADA